jgi:ADP-dependent NAD(P)H-hydrate dehydratase / NAD(P)H-hydrate epimerase
MRYAHTVEQVRAAEAALMATVPDGALMQRAAHGLGVVCADLLAANGVYGSRVLVVAGAGNNGGDALWAGAMLSRRGVKVEALLVASSVHEPGLEALLAAGGRVVTETTTAYDLVLDGVLGIGGRPGLDDDVAKVFDDADAPIVAVDVPSGVEVDTGRLDGSHVTAEVTVTFGTHKVAQLVEPAARACGLVELVDIGLGPYLPDPVLEVLQADDVRRLLPRPDTTSHKYTRGVLGAVAGSPQYTGAGVLVVSAAVATGLVGMVRYEGASEDLIRAAHPEVVIGPGQVQAWVLGSGIGRGLASSVASVLAERLPTVVDADGLRHLPARCESPTVLTPHAGELANMLDVPRSQVEGEMLACAQEAAERWNTVVLLKGAHSVIAAPDGRVRVNVASVPWLATAGAGDVLSGVIGALLAAGLDCFDAASVGAWLHGSAAAIASDGGPIVATDVVAALRETVRRTFTLR